MMASRESRVLSYEPERSTHPERSEGPNWQLS
jgi:hypothetical protein